MSIIRFKYFLNILKLSDLEKIKNNFDKKKLKNELLFLDQTGN
jgi:hypothetical protein